MKIVNLTKDQQQEVIQLASLRDEAKKAHLTAHKALDTHLRSLIKVKKTSRLSLTDDSTSIVIQGE